MNNIRFIKNTIIDKIKWDLCIEGSVNRTHYALSWYLDIVADKWDAVVYGDYELIFPVTYKNLVPFISTVKIIYQPMFCQQLGFFSNDIDLINDEKILKQMLSLVKKKYSSFRSAIIIMSLVILPFILSQILEHYFLIIFFMSIIYFMIIIKLSPKKIEY